MSHHHHPPHDDHDHHHHHHHGHDAVHDHGAGTAPDFDTKLARILEHWRRHNQDHLSGYRQWAEDAAAHGHAAVAAHLEAVLDLSGQITERLDQARDAMTEGA